VLSSGPDATGSDFTGGIETSCTSGCVLFGKDREGAVEGRGRLAGGGVEGRGEEAAMREVGWLSGRLGIELEADGEAFAPSLCV